MSNAHSAEPEAACRVFASYSHMDAAAVIGLVALLHSVGASIFRDKDSIPPGTRWKAEIERAIDHAEVVLVFWTANSADSEPVREEYERAISLGKRLIPVLLDHTPLASSLSEYQWIDLRKLWEKGKEEFAKAAESLPDLEERSREPVLTHVSQWQAELNMAIALLPSAIFLKASIGIMLSLDDAEGG